MTQISDQLLPGRPVVFRRGTVLPMDRGRSILRDTDVLVVGDRVEAIGKDLAAPDDALEIDASGGIVMPGMIDTHRHMWQTAMRGYGADWTLTQYFVWYYLESGKHFRPEDVHAGNLLAALEAVDAGVTTCVDWSHGLQTVGHAEAAVDALRSVPGRFVLAYGNIQQGPWEWSTSPDFQAFARRRLDEHDDLLGFQMAFDVTGDPAFPERAAFEVARDLGVPVTTHVGVWGATNDDGVRMPHEAGFFDETTTFVHASTLSADSYHRIAATGGSVSLATESEQSAGQGYPTSWALRAYGIPVSLSMDTSVWWSGDLFSAMRATLSADRSRDHLEAHARGDTVTNHALRAEQVVEWATLGGARALGRESDLGSVEVGKKADLVLLKNEHSPASFPILNPYGHVVYQAQRDHVHTVLVDGRVVKSGHRLVDADLAGARRAIESTVGYLRSTLGEQAWTAGMHPEVPEVALVENPYQYSDYSGAMPGR
jgi:cytosine/adenosine deaminase-related metal-dependent hydrolase